jgi:hypothetical protein
VAKRLFLRHRGKRNQKRELGLLRLPEIDSFGGLKDLETTDELR